MFPIMLKIGIAFASVIRRALIAVSLTPILAPAFCSGFLRIRVMISTSTKAPARITATLPMMAKTSLRGIMFLNGVKPVNSDSAPTQVPATLIPRITFPKIINTRTIVCSHFQRQMIMISDSTVTGTRLIRIAFMEIPAKRLPASIPTGIAIMPMRMPFATSF